MGSDVENSDHYLSDNQCEKSLVYGERRFIMSCKFLGKNWQCENSPLFHCDAWDLWIEEDTDRAMNIEVHEFCKTYEFPEPKKSNLEKVCTCAQ